MTENVSATPPPDVIIQNQTIQTPNTTDVGKIANPEMAESGIQIANIEEFQKKYPGFYDKFCESIANTIMKDLKKHQQRMKEIRRDAERNN